MKASTFIRGPCTGFLAPCCRDFLPFKSISSQTRPSTLFWFISKVIGRVEVLALCWPLMLFHTKPKTTYLHGPHLHGHCHETGMCLCQTVGNMLLCKKIILSCDIKCSLMGPHNTIPYIILIMWDVHILFAIQHILILICYQAKNIFSHIWFRTYNCKLLAF